MYPDLGDTSGPGVPSLSLLSHTMRTTPAEPSSLFEAGAEDAVLVDARYDLLAARCLCCLLSVTGRLALVLALVSEGQLVLIRTAWGAGRDSRAQSRFREDRYPVTAGLLLPW